MTSQPPGPFSINLNQLKSRNKDSSAAAIEKAEQAGEQLGFVDRAPKRRGGRERSPRTAQIHTKVLPPVAEELAAECARRGVTQGVLIEEGWALYKAQRDK